MNTRRSPTARRREAQLLAVVAHDLRSSLNGIKSWTHLLEQRLSDPDPLVRRALDGIMVGVDQQVRLIESLLEGAPGPGPGQVSES